ncbi:MBL fold metallo-hydrolase [Candidatus Woesearchaeota archaeon]|jgi:hydroxyacylglutathione hydrolase|nr:MBL fold metallo-hydrolase [Candidatus Woesearchaeota archaeon]MBT4150689.1 MBL fold metallo-hydrolase [Candidatus Woesearchaeota archaeon]MBT4247907.1 MBL fold metallo-hydrolase [Candidatus Woesearchaeota archaeon]MBT4434331.1 MBL fold metallo-hydrolase [Candidatus Woesearchaeota archaeon]MBT7332280.1 MBL fold metallo-hydrolase [Candidatus Woesearchaeota archaeon]
MNIKTFKGGYDDNFTYIIDNGKECIIIDPAVPLTQLQEYIKEHNLQLKFVVMMHSHRDHIVDLDKYKVPVYGHESTKIQITNPVKDNDEISIPNITFKVLHTPGHRFDCICLFDGKHLFTSDTLFIEGCGRVDFEGSEPELMQQTLEKIKNLPEHTIILPGHDYGSTPISTIGREKKNNPYLNKSEKYFLRFKKTL